MNKIGWCDKTVNPIIGCRKISESCQNCYAEIMANRLAGMKATKEDYSQVIRTEHILDIANGKWNGKTIFRPKELEKPYKWKKPQRIFITSMGDLFHETVDWDWLNSIISMILDNEHHIFIMLTKREKKMKAYFDWLYSSESPYCGKIPIPNLWLGCTVENQEQTKRINDLIKIPAAVHFISVEPMLGNIKIPMSEGWIPTFSNPDNSNCDQPAEPLIYALDWVICGAESGKKARYMNPEWARSLRDQCKTANVPFFMKKMSGNEPIPEDLQIREFPIKRY